MIGQMNPQAWADDGWMPISTAPRNGLTVLVADPDCGVFAMAWAPTAENPLVGDVMGLWEAPDRSMTWSEHDGCGPTFWKALPEEDPPQNLAREGALSRRATTNLPPALLKGEPR